MGRLSKEEKERRKALAELGLKSCSRCKENKPLDQFHKAAKEKDGLYSQCKQCRSEVEKKAYPRHREKRLARHKKRREENPDYYKEWREKNPDYYTNSWRLRAYRLTKEQYDQMLKDQNYVCAICGGVNKSGKVLSVDHDHSCCAGVKSCGKCVRKLLCDACNKMLGFARDNPVFLRQGAEYIEDHRQ